MQKTKCYLAALVSGVLLVTGIWAGYGQSKKNDHLTVYLWENRLMKNIASYDVVSKYYSYAVEYYKDTDDEIQWLPICAIPQTIIANKTLFDQYGIKVPENYEEYVQVCQQFYDKGIKPYSMDLAEDWSNQEIIQAAAIGEFTSLDGIDWRNKAETSAGEIKFDDVLWKRIFSETSQFLKDSHFSKEDINVNITTGTQMFVEGKSAMFHGQPTDMQKLQDQMDAELIRIPYFSQTSDSSFVYMFPSLNIAFNKELEKNQEKLDTALDVLDCMISEQGQKLIADGSGVISLNTDVPSMMQNVPGLEEEIKDTSIYIRYSAQKSFDASLEAVHGLLSGKMDEMQAYNAFRSAMNSKDSKEKSTVNFENEYSISLNDKSGRDAASSILTTIRKENDAQLALTPYYYYTSSIYKGECTSSRVGLMTAKNSDTPLYLVKLNGEQVYELVKKYLTEADENFYVTTKYELPIASGMKIIVKNEENGFSLKDITINDKKIDTEKEYSILLTDTTKSILEKINPKCAIEQIGDTTLSSAWIAAMSNGQQPSAPEDYIEVEK